MDKDINYFDADTPLPGLVRMSDIKPEEVKYLWYPYIPHSRVTLVRGHGDQGKTTFCMKLAAAITTGGSMPDGNGGFVNVEQGNVLYISAEDKLKDTISPRFIKTGADMDRVYSHDNENPDTPLIHFMHPLFEALIARTQSTLVIVDPMQGFFGNKDMNRANHVRPIMTHLSVLAGRYNCSIVIIEHMGKSGRGGAFNRGLGSIDITSAARSVIMVGSDPDNPEERGICHIKSNLSRKGNVIGFTIDNDGLSWNPDTYLTADIIEGTAPRSRGRDSEALEEAKDFLTDALEKGRKFCSDVESEAIQIGISVATLRRARESLNIQTDRQGFGMPGYWRLPHEQQ
jgi:hypothetical protein